MLESVDASMEEYVDYRYQSQFSITISNVITTGGRSGSFAYRLNELVLIVLELCLYLPLNKTNPMAAGHPLRVARRNGKNRRKNPTLLKMC